MIKNITYVGKNCKTQSEVKKLDKAKFSYATSCKCRNKKPVGHLVSAKLPCQGKIEHMSSVVDKVCSGHKNKEGCKGDLKYCEWKGVRNPTKEKILLGSCNRYTSLSAIDIEPENENGSECGEKTSDTLRECVSDLSYKGDVFPSETMLDFVAADPERWSITMKRRDGNGVKKLDFVFSNDPNQENQEIIYGRNRAEYIIDYFDSCGYKAATRRIVFNDNNPPVISWPSSYNESKPYHNIIAFLNDVKPTAFDAEDDDVPVHLEFRNTTTYLKFPQDLEHLNSGIFIIRATAHDLSRNEATDETKSVNIQPNNDQPLPSTASSSTEDESALTVILVAVLIVALAFVGIIMLRKREKPEDLMELFNGKDGLQMSKEPREIPRSSIEIISELGAGAFGEVLKGLFEDGELLAPAYIVAIKTLRSEHSAAERMEMLREAATTAQADHAYVVGLVGVVTKGSPLFVVLQFCEHGKF